MHEHEKRVLEGLLFLSGDEGLSIEQLNGCVEELDKKEIEVVLDELMQDYLADVHGIELVRFGGIYKFRQSEQARSHAHPQDNPASAHPVPLQFPFYPAPRHSRSAARCSVPHHR